MRRLISLVSVTVALVGLGFVLVNATTVDRRPPSVKSISLSSPAGDPHVAQVLSAIDIEFSEPVKSQTAESRFRIDPVIDGTFTWDGATAIFTPARKLPQDTSFTISVGPGVEDLEGNVDPVGLDQWQFATVGAPVVLHATPADGVEGVPLDGAIDLVFDRLMDTKSVEAAISLTPSAGVTATWSGSVVTLTLGQGVRPGTEYLLTVAATASDTGGSRLGAPYRQTFSTVGSGLEVVSLTPPGGVAGIGIASPIAIRFNAPIDPSTALSAVHITPNVEGTVRLLALNGDGSSTSTSAPAGAANTLVFVPSTLLAPHTTYTVTLDPTVARLDDPGSVTAGRTWSFTTGAPPQSGQNQITFLSSRGGVRNVWIMNPDGTNQRQVTVELLPVSSYDVSADGGHIVYAAGGVASVMAIDGSGLRRLTEDDGRLEYGPYLAPGDLRIVVARRSAGGQDLGYWLVPLPGTPGEERQLLDHGAPSPDSASLEGDGNSEIDGTPSWAPRLAFDAAGQVALIVTAAGTTQIVDTREPGRTSGELAGPISLSLVGDAPPVWAPNRNAFVVAGTPTWGGSRRLFVVSTGGRLGAITGTDGAVGPVAVSADGSLAFVARAPGGRAATHVISSSGEVIDTDGQADRDDRWSAFAPDPGTLLVDRSLAAAPTVSDGIWAIDLRTGQARRLTVDGALARWAP